ncbi:MAG: hypothetical protein JNK02_04680 [Planctomycetes bacterium]|nr:hypothetical protein [Planctomycetota bacterium]
MSRNRPDRRRDQLFGAHAFLAAAWAGWHVLENTPGLASAWGGSFTAEVPGRALALATLLGAVLALGVVTVRTLALWRDPRALLLGAALLAALPARGDGPDVFDLTYAGLSALLATDWFARGRAARD